MATILRIKETPSVREIAQVVKLIAEAHTVCMMERLTEEDWNTAMAKWEAIRQLTQDWR